jgi:hypothetical protein
MGNYNAEQGYLGYKMYSEEEWKIHWGIRYLRFRLKSFGNAHSNTKCKVEDRYYTIHKSVKNKYGEKLVL